MWVDGFPDDVLAFESHPAGAHGVAVLVLANLGGAIDLPAGFSVIARSDGAVDDPVGTDQTVWLQPSGPA